MTDFDRAVGGLRISVQHVEHVGSQGKRALVPIYLISFKL